MGLKDRLKKNKNTISKKYIESVPDSPLDNVVPIRQGASQLAGPDSYEKVVAEITDLQAEMAEVEKAIQERKAERAKIAVQLVERIMFVRQNPQILPINATTGERIFFTEFLEQLGMEKQYIYEQIAAYNFCEKYGYSELFGHLDYKVFVLLSRIPGINKKRARSLLGKAKKEGWTRPQAERLLHQERLAHAELDPIAAEFLEKLNGIEDEGRKRALKKQLNQIFKAAPWIDSSSKK